MRPLIVSCIFFVIVLSGCVSPGIEKGHPVGYELPGQKNTTIYYLNASSIKVVDSVINSTSVSINFGDNTNLNIRDAVAVDYAGNNVSFNATKEAIFGKSYIVFKFDSTFNGFIAFTMQNGQDFHQEISKNGSIYVILPQNHTTGSRFLGIAQPKTYNTTIDTSGREVLIWENPYPDYKSVSVKYYHESAPTILFYFFVFFVILTLLIIVYYYKNIKDINKEIDSIKEKTNK